MKLYYTDWSPFARKVLVAAIERGLEDEIELVPAEIGFAEGTLKVKESELSSYNPSGRVPTLLTESGKTIFDSTVIVNYLDGIGIAPPIIPLYYKLRVAALRLNALVDEVIDAMRHLSFENRRPEEFRLPDYIKALTDKVNRGLSLLEQESEEFKPINETIDIGIISVGCLIQSIKIRQPSSIFNKERTNLDSWLEKLFIRQSMEKPKPPAL